MWYVSSKPENLGVSPEVLVGALAEGWRERTPRAKSFLDQRTVIVPPAHWVICSGGL